MDDQNCNIQLEPHMLILPSPKHVNQNNIQNETANGVQNQKDSKTVLETASADEILLLKEKCTLLENKLDLVLCS